MGLLNQLFVHARNVLTGTLIVAAGLYATHHPQPIATLGTWTVHFAGYAIATVGVVLLLLNLIDGLWRLSQRAYPLALRAAAGFVYFALTVRLVQVVGVPRAGCRGTFDLRPKRDQSFSRRKNRRYNTPHSCRLMTSICHPVNHQVA